MKLLVTAASGNIGSRVAEQIVAAGAEAVLLSRHPAKLSALSARGAQVLPIGSDDAPGLLSAAQGADALFFLAPPNPGAKDLRDWYTQTATAAAQAVREHRIPRVVCISTVGAHANAPLGTIAFAAEMEERFNRAAPHVLHLRPGYFMENCLSQVESIRHGVLSFPYAEDHDMPWISTDDIGDVAAKYLLDGSWTGHWTRNLLGPENLTLPEVAARISQVAGKPIRYVQVSPEAVQHQLEAQGVNPTVRQQLGDLFRALGDPNGIYATARTPEAFTPTTFETFARNKLLPLLATGG
ncbi:NmrA family NAD(P)-binding protein [Stigmatella aurantiaca]|uniref:NmrA-like domain-containing protein n=1 Tax=Stigmatella aurantiaca (strain DW4/3-1) TaxID=378806 RepID=Q09AJ7_STIAD|nr:NmrA family NAD(P)-binding protein [Stigmatella aurantiaca]EAU68720.1 conserved hypothetical protein [Stigmatella aurantiaca DW4/3-1]